MPLTFVPISVNLRLSVATKAIFTIVAIVLRANRSDQVGEGGRFDDHDAGSFRVNSELP
jgi:hypothetical protein